MYRWCIRVYIVFTFTHTAVLIKQKKITPPPASLHKIKSNSVYTFYVNTTYKQNKKRACVEIFAENKSYKISIGIEENMIYSMYRIVVTR